MTNRAHYCEQVPAQAIFTLYSHLTPPVTRGNMSGDLLPASPVHTWLQDLKVPDLNIWSGEEN